MSGGRKTVACVWVCPREDWPDLLRLAGRRVPSGGDADAEPAPSVATYDEYLDRIEEICAACEAEVYGVYISLAEMGDRLGALRLEHGERGWAEVARQIVEGSSWGTVLGLRVDFSRRKDGRPVSGTLAVGWALVDHLGDGARVARIK